MKLRSAGYLHSFERPLYQSLTDRTGSIVLKNSLTDALVRGSEKSTSVIALYEAIRASVRAKRPQKSAENFIRGLFQHNRSTVLIQKYLLA